MYPAMLGEEGIVFRGICQCVSVCVPVCLLAQNHEKIQMHLNGNVCHGAPQKFVIFITFEYLDI